jgi:hypothetical protein
MELHPQSYYTPSFRVHGQLYSFITLHFTHILRLYIFSTILAINRSLHNINRLAFVTKNGMFSARRKRNFYNFTARNSSSKALKRRCISLYSGKEIIFGLGTVTAGKVSEQGLPDWRWLLRMT